MAPTFVPDDGGDLTEGVGSVVCVLSDADVDIEDPGVEVEGIEDVGVTVVQCIAWVCTADKPI